MTRSIPLKRANGANDEIDARQTRAEYREHEKKKKRKEKNGTQVKIMSVRGGNSTAFAMPQITFERFDCTCVCVRVCI